MKINSKKIAKFLDAKIFGRNLTIESVKSIDQFEENTLSFSTKELTDKNFLTKGFLILDSSVTIPKKVKFSYVLSDNARLDFAMVVENFFNENSSRNLLHLSYIDPSSMINKGVIIGSGCFIGKNVSIGDKTVIGNNVSIFDNVKIGKECFIKSGTVIGEKGFGFAFDEKMIPIKIPHIGSVVIGDSVEIGALNTICRGTLSDTKIGPHTKTDDHVHIAHNCEIGRACIITASVCCGGSVKTGNYCWFGLNSTIMNRINLGNYVMVGTHENVINNSTDYAVLAGSPARRVGWISRVREKLDLPLAGEGSAVCPKTKENYLLKDSKLDLLK